MMKPNILVLCTGNSARSQIAEALLRKHGGEQFDVYSAGTDPKGMNPYTVRCMSEIGIDVSAQRSKHLKEYLGILPVKFLITVCGNADENCPVWPGDTQRLHWPFEDPAACMGSDEEKLAKFRTIRDQIEAHVKQWLARKEK
jgi:arsenate reductase (thioredoxin)